MNKRIVVSVFFLVFCKIMVSQTDSVSKKNASNVIHANIGLFEYNFNYERKVFELHKSYINLRLGYGSWKDWGGEGDNIFFSSQYLLGKRKSHLEIGFGLKIHIDDCCGNPWFYNFNNIYSLDLLPIYNIGYRYEKPTRGMIFRLGVGTESLFNVGTGYKF